MRSLKHLLGPSHLGTAGSLLLRSFPHGLSQQKEHLPCFFWYLLNGLALNPAWLEELEACWALEVRWISRLLEELEAIGQLELEAVGREFV